MSRLQDIDPAVRKWRHRQVYKIANSWSNSIRKLRGEAVGNYVFCRIVDALEQESDVVLTEFGEAADTYDRSITNGKITTVPTTPAIPGRDDDTVHGDSTTSATTTVSSGDDKCTV